MPQGYSEFGRIVNRIRWGDLDSIPNMDGQEPKFPAASKVLWKNCEALMLKHYGKVNISRFGRDTGIGNGGVTRIRDGDSVGLDLIQRVAKKFRLQAWQLLVDGFEPDNPPVVSLTDTEKKLYDRLKKAAEAFNAN